jgi:2-phosphoglycerate kinase
MINKYNVFLIGGSSGTGKSTLAIQLAYHLKFPLCEVDNIRIAMQQIADPERYPKLFTFLNSKNYRYEMSVIEFVQNQIDVSFDVWKALKVLIQKHDYLQEKVIFEGDNILPMFTQEIKSDSILEIYIYDTEEDISKKMSSRKRHNIADDEIKKDAEFSFNHGQEIMRQAKENNCIIIQATPLETLCERVIKEIENNL